jgi:hypothetical protein
MPHNDWCGKPCSECENPCSLDESISCSPDCEALNKDGTKNFNECMESGCDNFGTTVGECPVCDNKELTYGDSGKEGNSYIYKWKCENCGNTGKELYALEFVQHKVD